MKCPNCQKNKAIKHSVYGILPCKPCQASHVTVKRGPEFTSDSIRGQRREYRKDIIQPYRDGVLSKEYIEEYGTQGIEPSKEAIKHARYTYKDTPGWWQRNKSKGGKRGKRKKT